MEKNTADLTDDRDRTGVEDVMRSLRELLRSTRELAMDVTEVAEREVAMAISISERLRDNVFSAEALKEVREEGMTANVRRDAHRIVDLVVDVGGVAIKSLVDFFEDFADLSRPPLKNDGGVIKRDQAVTVKVS